MSEQQTCLPPWSRAQECLREPKERQERQLDEGIQVELSLTDSDKSQETSEAKVSGDYLDLFKDGKQSHGSKLQKGPGVLLIEARRDDGTIVELQNSSQNSFLSFMYSIHDVQSLKRHVTERNLRIRTWKSKMAAEQKSLMEEAGEFQDLLLVDVVDVYRTLPAKLLECHVWFAGNFRAAHILKTDDDTYLDLMQAVSILSSVPLVAREWWGNFRREWTVERFGKWREPDYASLVYPPFACGSGYVVSHVLHQWLAANSRYLHSFQGEDVSMGIWLAPLAPPLLQDSRWQCFKTCQDSMLAMPELTPTDLAAHWSNKLHCSSPCSSC